MGLRQLEYIEDGTETYLSIIRDNRTYEGFIYHNSFGPSLANASSVVYNYYGHRISFFCFNKVCEQIYLEEKEKLLAKHKSTERL